MVVDGEGDGEDILGVADEAEGGEASSEVLEVELRRSSVAAAPLPPKQVRLNTGNSMATQLRGEQQQL